jgi:LAO/AO transport system kinase
VKELVDAIDRFRAHTASELGERRRARAEWRVRELMAHRFVQHVHAHVLGAGEFERLLDRIAARDTDPYTVVDDIFRRTIK